MLKKIMTVFLRDLKVNTRDFMTLYIIVVPIIFAIGINFFTPSVNDTTVNLALIEGENTTQEEYLKNFAKVEVLADEEAVKKRVEGRDSVIGLVPSGESYQLIAEGNEPEGIIDFAKVLEACYELGLDIEDTNAKILDFGRDVPPIKKLLVNIAILFTCILAGMLIAINIVEEKADNTISAIHLSPVSRIGFILGKSMMGVMLAVVGSLSLIFVTGFYDVNIGQMLVAVFACTVLSILIGFIQGIQNDDIMSAAGNLKLLFLPMGAAAAAIELLGDKWQKFFYWIPFYWTYKGNIAVLSKTATWPQILSYSGIVLAISGIVFVLLAPKIRKGLE